MSKERELFLAHMRSIGSAGFMFELDDNGNFDDMSMAYAWSAWQAAKAQALPEWKDYTVESPRIDGPYQIFIMDQQLVAKWESPWGFSSIEDGDAFNQELITHWSVLGSDPLAEPSSTSDCPDEP